MTERRWPHRAFEGFASAGAEAHYAPDMALEPVHLELHLQLWLERRRLEGRALVTIQANRAHEERLQLHAVGLEIEAVRDAQGGALWHSYDGEELLVRWEAPWAQGERRALEIEWSVQDPRDGLFFSAPDAVEPDRALYAATDHETERARHWLPCVDLPAVRTSLDIHLRVEAGLTALANGLLVGEEAQADGTKIARWRLEEPCPSYLICFVVGDLVCAQDGDFEGRPLAYYAAAERDPEDLRRSFGRTRAMMAWMVERLGVPFPYPKYYQFGLPDFSGAMENISLVSWDDVFVLDEALAQEWTWQVDQINVHEMAHSYFGDLVVCRDFAHAWLKESWATYIESCWLEASSGEDEQRYNLYTDARLYFEEADGRYQRALMTRVYDSSWDLYDMHLYPGGACRLHTLRCLLGDEAFWGATRDYLTRYAHRVAETDDLRRVMEERSGRSLARFFDQWIYGAGYPHLKVSFRYDDKERVGTFEIEQTQLEKDKEAKPFTLSLELGWVIGGELHLRPVELSRARHSVRFAMESDPEQVRVDPRGLALHKLEFNPGDARLRRQLTGARDVVGRIQAGLTLIEGGRRRNLEAVRAAWAQEPFWGVRVEWARGMGEAVGAEAAVEAMVDWLGQERDPMVLRHLCAAASRLRDPRIAAALRARLDEGLPGYFAAQEAWAALGAQPDGAPLERLIEAAQTPSFRGLVQVGALRALGRSRRVEAWPALQALSRRGGAQTRARVAACAAIGALGLALEPHHRPPMRAHLIDLLRDPVLRVQKAAAQALVAMKATEAADALTAWSAARSHQDQVLAARWLDALRKAPSADALQKDLDAARDKLRKLEDRLAALEARLLPAAE